MSDAGPLIQRRPDRFPMLRRAFDLCVLLLVGVPMALLLLLIVEVAFAAICVLGFARRMKKKLKKNHKKMNKPNLSQSLLKAYVDYYDENVKGCGTALYKQFFERQPVPSSDTMRLGVYFEYLCTGYVREGDPIPEPELSYKGTAKEKLSADYERAHKSAELFKRMVAEHGIEITKVGEYMLHDGVSGISDVRGKFQGEDCIIDIKYTSLFDDKFSEYGWHTESLVFKSKLLLQPIHYKYLIRKTDGIGDIPFYFFIFSSKDPEKAKIVRVDVQEEHVNLHESITIPKMKKYVSFHHKNPSELQPRPSYLRCKDCAFADGCEHRASVPNIETIHY